MNAQTTGILLGLFSLAFAALVFWGGFSEQKRASEGKEAAGPPVVH